MTCTDLEPVTVNDSAGVALPAGVRFGVAVGQTVQHCGLSLERRRVLRQNLEVRLHCNTYEYTIKYVQVLYGYTI